MIERQRKQDVSGFFSSQYQKLVRSFRAKYADLSEMEVEDLVSGMMTDLFDKIDISEQVENVGAYIYSSIQNRVIDYLRRKKKGISLDDTRKDAHDKPETSSLEPKYDMQDEIDSWDTRERLITALDKLGANQRAVWVATEIGGYTFRELAEAWEVPIGTLLSRKHRAVAALQIDLKDLKSR